MEPSSKITAIIIVNILFMIVVGYTSYAAKQRIIGGIERIRVYMDDLLDFVFMRTNRIKKAQYMKNDEIGLILTELNKHSDNFDRERKIDTRVLGEVVLVLDKVSQGIFTCRINADSNNFMVRAVKKSLNNIFYIWLKLLK